MLIDSSVASRPIDVVHAHGLRAGLVAGLARTGLPLVVTWHNAVLAKGLRGQASALVERIVARGATLTLGASEDLVSRALAVGARNAKINITPATITTSTTNVNVTIDLPMSSNSLIVGRFTGKTVLHSSSTLRTERSE